MSKFEINKKWLKEASKPIQIREGATQKEIDAEVKKQFKKLGLTK